jgi:hypothetical protein
MDDTGDFLLPTIITSMALCRISTRPKRLQVTLTGTANIPVTRRARRLENRGMCAKGGSEAARGRRDSIYGTSFRVLGITECRGETIISVSL